MSTRTRKTPPKADSLRQAAGILGTTHAVLRAAKEAGCPGFHNGRVDVDQVRTWLAKNPVAKSEAELSPIQAQRLRKLRLDADAKEFALQVKRGDYLHKEDVRTAVMRAISAARSVLNGKASSLALALSVETGIDPATLEERIKDSNREVILEMHRMPFGTGLTTCPKCQHQHTA